MHLIKHLFLLPILHLNLLFSPLLTLGFLKGLNHLLFLTLHIVLRILYILLSSIRKIQHGPLDYSPLLQTLNEGYL